MGFEHWFYKIVLPFCYEGQYWMDRIGLTQWDMFVAAPLAGLVFTAYALYLHFEDVKNGIYKIQKN